MSPTSSELFHDHSNSAPPIASTVQVGEPPSGNGASLESSIEAKKSETKTLRNNENSDHIPAPCRIQSPKTRHEPPANLRMHQHNLLESLGLGKSSPPPSLSPSLSLPPSKKPINTMRTSRDDDVPKNDKRSNSNPNSQQLNKQKQQGSYNSAASLVVCGVDGTVFTLDAYSGQLRGMFSSGPALVHSSDVTPERNSDEAAASGDDEYISNPDTTASSVISTAPRLQWKERVVPGLDGRLYSLSEQSSLDDFNEDEENMQSQCQQGEMTENDDFLDELCHSASSDEDTGGTDLSINSVPKIDRYNLQPLPISVMDVVDSPISTCRPVMDFDEAFEGLQRQQCGIVVGSKKTTIYAIDPMTGKIRWTQDPHGGGGAKGFTTGRPADARGKPTVLLQREDYAVRHLDTDGGEEVWKVELGRFSALDFDVDAHKRTGTGTNHGRDEDEMMEDPVIIGGRRRSAAATAASNGKDKQRPDLPPILGGGTGRKKFGSFRDEPDFESDDFNYHDNFSYGHSNFRAFPSVAFGEDGTSIIAVDGISGELLWKRQIESVVAAVYGVGKSSTWVPLDVIDESEVLTHGKQHGTSLLPSSASSSTSGGLVPYGSNQMESGQLHRLGRHHNHLFVSSKFDPLGMNPPTYPEPNNAHDYVDDLGKYEELPPKQTPLFPQVPYPLPADVSPPVSHRTEHGLYLTWSMVSAIMALLFSVLVFARVFYLRQKKKWENTPTLAPATAPNSYEDSDVRDLSLSPRGHLPPAAAFADESRLSAPASWWKMSVDDTNTQAPARSLSLGALGCQAEPAVKPFTKQNKRDSNKNPPLKPNSIPFFGDSQKSSTGVTPASPAITRSLTVPDGEEPKQSGIDNIDGIPLVRYSRFRSEFKELSALGRGGFGTVFRCENALDSREYAIKKIWIKSQLCNGKVTEHFSQKLHRVLREVKILALLDHPNIVRYYTAWLEADDETKATGDETSTTNSILSPSLFSSFGSTSKGLNSIFKTKGSLFSKSNKGGIASYMPKGNPLGWNNFGSFRLEESGSKLSEVDENMTTLADSQEASLGFVWERSQGNSVEQLSAAKLNVFWPDKNPTLNEEVYESSSSSSGVSSVNSEESVKDKSYNPSAKSDNQSEKKSHEKSSIGGIADKDDTQLFMTEGRHVLYIQMQLCRAQTLADFLGNRHARIGSLADNSSELDSYAVDIPFALRLFSQIARGVKYVHKQGLIHRDLKPMNVFIDDAGNVKVGDFGLSRETSTVGGISAFDDDADETDATAVNHEGPDDAFGGDAENTAGVGTRAYASPEQMKGSNYDTSTDVFSLGLILFELCYPLYTAHERYKEFSGIRRGAFPIYWDSHVKTSYPSLHDILVRMISPVPSKRPTAADVSEQIDNLLSEYQVQSLDKSWGRKGAIFLRVETIEAEGVLARAMKLIKAAAPHAVILQYGLRSTHKDIACSSKAIMEFAIEITVDQKLSLEKISSSLRNNEMIVRQISNQ